MKKIFQFLGVIGLSMAASSCYYDALPDASVIPIPENISYQNEIQPIFNQSCTSCHDGGLDPDLRSGTSYTALTANNAYVIPSDAENSVLYKALIGEGAPLMPPDGGLSQAKINLVKQWINEGALNN